MSAQLPAAARLPAAPPARRARRKDYREFFTIVTVAAGAAPPSSKLLRALPTAPSSGQIIRFGCTSNLIICPELARGKCDRQPRSAGCPGKKGDVGVLWFRLEIPTFPLGSARKAPGERPESTGERPESPGEPPGSARRAPGAEKNRRIAIRLFWGLPDRKDAQTAGAGRGSARAAGAAPRTELRPGSRPTNRIATRAPPTNRIATRERPHE